MNATPAQIEEWLWRQHGWVTTEHICQRFDVTKRQLRSRGNCAGLLHGFGISRSQGGYIHIDHASEEEIGTHCNNRMDHGKAEIDGAQALLTRWKTGPRYVPPAEPVQAEMPV